VNQTCQLNYHAVTLLVLSLDNSERFKLIPDANSGCTVDESRTRCIICQDVGENSRCPNCKNYHCIFATIVPGPVILAIPSAKIVCLSNVGGLDNEREGRRLLI